MEELLRVENLTVSFRQSGEVIHAVDDLSFSVNKGETVALVGESGCGKTATALSIMHLVEHGGGRIAGGRILFNGDDLVPKRGRHMRRINGKRIGMVFQEPMTSLNPMLTVGYQIVETLRSGLHLSAVEARERAIELLNAVGIDSASKSMRSYSFQLSGGQRQRVMIALALCCNPDLLIADEPTTALDVTIQAQILDLLRSMKENAGMALLLITHDLGVVADLAQRVVVMYGGQLVEQGTVYEIFDNPRHPYTKGLMQAIPRITLSRERLYTIPGTVLLPTEYAEGCRFADRCSRCRDICRTMAPPLQTDGKSRRELRCFIGTEIYLKSGEVSADD